MKRIALMAAVFTFLALSLPYNLLAASMTSKEAEASVTGILHCGQMPDFQIGAGYWLRSDEPLYVHKGSKSEASTDVLVLNVPVELREKSGKLHGRRITVTGSMNCTSHGWGPGYASCNMIVQEITELPEGTK